MKLFEMLDILPNKKECISIVGAGGKTTALFTIANELYELKRKIIITTTTHLFIPEVHQYHKALISTNSEKILQFAKNIEDPGIYLIGSSVTTDNKLVGIDSQTVDMLNLLENIDYIIVEADGSKQKPIKAPKGHEPVIPESATIVIGVIGLDCINQSINENNVHRLEEFCKICNCNPQELINIDMLVKLIDSEKGLFKGTPASAQRYILLNKADQLINIESLMQFQNEISNNSNKNIILNSFIENIRIKI